MNGKPKNWSALCKSVHAADVAAMPSKKWTAKLADKLILVCLAQATSGDSGKGARPGNAALMKACGLEWRQTHDHLRLLINAGMIKRDEIGNGAWNASVYSILYNHPVFPDHSPNMREWFIIGRPEDAPNHADSDAPNHADSSKPCGFEGETMRFKGSNHAVSESNHAVSLAARHPNPIQTQPNPASKPTAGGRDSSKTLPAKPDMVAWQAQLPDPMNTEAMGRHEKSVCVFVQSKGAVLATAYLRAWLDSGRNLKGMNDKWYWFLKEAELHAKAAVELTPEGRAAAQRRQDEMVEVAAKRVEQIAREQLEKAGDIDKEVEETQRMLKELSK